MTETISNNVKDNKAFQKRAQCFVIQPFGETVHSKTGTTINNDEVYNELAKLNSIQPNFPRVLGSDLEIGIYLTI